MNLTSSMKISRRSSIGPKPFLGLGPLLLSKDVIWARTRACWTCHHLTCTWLSLPWPGLLLHSACQPIVHISGLLPSLSPPSRVPFIPWPCGQSAPQSHWPSLCLCFSYCHALQSCVCGSLGTSLHLGPQAGLPLGEHSGMPARPVSGN